MQFPFQLLDLVDVSQSSCDSLNTIDPSCVLLTCVRNQSYAMHTLKFKVTGFSLLRC